MKRGKDTCTSARLSGINTDGSYDFQVREVNPVGKGESTVSRLCT